MSANNTNTAGTSAAPPVNIEEDLRHQLRSALRSLKRREPHEPTYKRLLLQNGRLAAPPILPKDKTYRRVGADLRARVERFMETTAGKDPFDRLSQRKPLPEEAMRAALTLREAKEHEQQALLEATLASLPRRQGMDPIQRKRHLDAIALGLQSRRPTLRQQQQQQSRGGGGKSNTPTAAAAKSHAEQTEQARRKAELDRQKAQARAREEARQQRAQEERSQREQELQQQQRQQQQQQRTGTTSLETSQQALHKLYSPVFKVLWNMEFAHLGGTNPFRMVIDRENCASVGAPDYFDVIQKAMNLTYIQRKVDAQEYESLSAFFADVELMLKNAITYNSDETNPYRIAAEEMRQKFKRLARKVLEVCKKHQLGT